MTDAEKEKLEDYLSGFRELENPYALPIGTVIIKEDDRPAVLQSISATRSTIIETEGLHPDIPLRTLYTTIKKEGMAVLNLKEELPAKIANQLANLASGVFHATLAGNATPAIIAPLSPKAKVMLVLTDEMYQNFPFQNIISSVCRLTALKE